MNGIEIMFKESNWKIPKLIKGDQIRFNYWWDDRHQQNRIFIKPFEYFR